MYLLAILFSIGAFLVAIGHFTKKRAAYAFPKALAVGVVAWFAAHLLFAVGKVLIVVAFIALIVVAVVLFVRRIGGKGVL